MYLLILILSVPPFLCFWIARLRNANLWYWVILGILFTPLSIFFVFLIPNVRKRLRIFETAKKILSRYPSRKYQIRNTILIVNPLTETTFPIKIGVCGDWPGYEVHLAGWHSRFNNENDALACFALGLSEDSRLKVIRYGNTEYSWSLERKNNDKWIQESTIKRWLVPFWRKKQVVYLNNTVQ